MAKWEYKVAWWGTGRDDTSKYADQTEMLNARGAEGWELVSVVPSGVSPRNGGATGFNFYLKRSIEDTPAMRREG